MRTKVVRSSIVKGKVVGHGNIKVNGLAKVSRGTTPIRSWRSNVSQRSGLLFSFEVEVKLSQNHNRGGWERRDCWVFQTTGQIQALLSLGDNISNSFHFDRTDISYKSITTGKYEFAYCVDILYELKYLKEKYQRVQVLQDWFLHQPPKQILWWLKLSLRKQFWAINNKKKCYGV
ncbi:hypothetical protein O6P43_017714 [Quillaja saponaria]|uniref:Uncharacterized protein n=1 Tax=Quillaja saponaria TaxID=32244 RepID=A0AAD7LQJ3_QUISA|nr:hypothetical protein O6P43_017714 [Quillaja saponaria]